MTHAATTHAPPIFVTASERTAESSLASPGRTERSVRSEAFLREIAALVALDDLTFASTVVARREPIVASIVLRDADSPAAGDDASTAV